MERHTRASWWVSHRLLAGGNLHLCITPYYFLLKKISHNLLAGGNFLAYINFYVSSAFCVAHEIGESFSLSLKVSKDHKLSPAGGWGQCWRLLLKMPQMICTANTQIICATFYNANKELIWYVFFITSQAIRYRSMPQKQRMFTVCPFVKNNDSVQE